MPGFGRFGARPKGSEASRDLAMARGRLVWSCAWWAAAILAQALLGCQTGEPPANPPAAQAAPALAAEPAAADPVPEGLPGRLVGTWHVDLASLAAAPEFRKMPPKEKQMALSLASQVLAHVAFEFSADGKVTMGTGVGERAGTYAVDSVEGNALRLTLQTGEGADAREEKVVIRVEGDALWVTEGDDGRTLRLLKGPPPAPPEQPASMPASVGLAAPPRAQQPASMPTGRGTAGLPTSMPSAAGSPAGHPPTGGQPTSMPAAAPNHLPAGHPMPAGPQPSSMPVGRPLPPGHPAPAPKPGP